MNIYNVLLKPILSEKTNKQRESNNKFCFKVAQTATKTDIHKAIEKLFSVKVCKINTSLVRGKMKRRGMYEYKDRMYKKAVITLAEGQTLAMFADL